jgi:succinoglycan biosynthesis transport protein ExoP
MGGQEDNAIDLRALFLTLWGGKWIIAICALIGTFLGFLMVSQATPVYRASAKVMFDLQQSSLVNRSDVFVDNQSNADELEDQMQVLRSAVLVERVIDQLNLDQNPGFNPFLRAPTPTLGERSGGFFSLPPEVVEIAINVGLISAPSPPPGPVEVARRERLSVMRNVLSGLALKAVGYSSVIEISYSSGRPKTSADLANAFADQYIVDQLEAKLAATQASTSWLSKRVDDLRVAVETTVVSIEDARLALSDEAGQGQTFDVTQQQIQALNAAVAAQTSEKWRLQSLYDRMSTAVDEGMDVGMVSELRASSLIQRYRYEEIDLTAEKLTLENVLNPDHPSIVAIEKKLELIRLNMAQEAGLIVTSILLDLRAAQDQELELSTEVRHLEQKAVLLSGDRTQLRQLERELEANRLLYASFLARLQETTAQQDLQEPDARVLSPAEQPSGPENQNKRRTFLIMTIGGGLIGIGIVFLLERLNNSFRSPAQLEALTGEVILGVLPAIGSRMKRGDVINHLREKPGSSLVEAVRNLRTSILFSNIDTPPKVVMFTSSVPREGKSTSAMLVALTSRQMGKSAVIVDCDLRLPTLSALIGSGEREHGLMSALEGSCEVDDAVFIDPETGLHVLTTVRYASNTNINAADILSSQKFEELIGKLSEAYDLVILDTPPTLVVADARIISKLAEAVVYVVRWDATPRGAVMEGLKDLRSLNAPIAGIVMTMVNEGRASKYAYDGYSYYKGKYKDYYHS